MYEVRFSTAGNHVVRVYNAANNVTLSGAPLTILVTPRCVPAVVWQAYTSVLAMITRVHECVRVHLRLRLLFVLTLEYVI